MNASDLLIVRREPATRPRSVTVVPMRGAGEAAGDLVGRLVLRWGLPEARPLTSQNSEPLPEH